MFSLGYVSRIPESDQAQSAAPTIAPPAPMNTPESPEPRAEPAVATVTPQDLSPPNSPRQEFVRHVAEQLPDDFRAQLGKQPRPVTDPEFLEQLHSRSEPLPDDVRKQLESDTMPVGE